MLGGIGMPEVMVIGIIVVLVFGAGKLPAAVGEVGKAIKSFRKEAGDGA
ncbi:MAG: twin-arginine translocase TatA/TatE family subunit [Rhodocyclaceae bacterium]|nr:twin-arginine translocase TatA/TatE family subunit [Rhodocyclaceae bacterium]MBK6906276.1 twin-arginine translocase TatA/TatE family subunit [Rhodocyclaceae bacterium]